MTVYNKIYLFIVNIIVLISVLIIFMSFSFAQSDTKQITVFNHDITSGIQSLDDPFTGALFLNIKPVINNETSLVIKTDIVYAWKRNLGEKANFSLAWGPSWKIPGEMKQAPEGIPSIRREYRGTMKLEVGLESAPEKKADDEAGDWQVADEIAGIVIEQHVPFTRIQFPWLSQESWPLIIGGLCKYVYDQEQENSSRRASLLADWDICVINTLFISIFIGGRYETYFVHDSDESAHFNYFEGRSQVSVPKITELNYFGEPVIFVKYIYGHQPPEYIKRKEWQFGLGTKLTF